MCIELISITDAPSKSGFLAFVNADNKVRVMAHIGNGVEYALHCLLWLVDPDSASLSSRELAEMQGISPAFLAKIFPRLERPGW